MVSWSSSKGGWAALGIALAIGAVIAWTQRSDGPSRAELARALTVAGNRIATADIKSLWCEEQIDRYVCRWKQHEGHDWRDRAGDVRMSADGWRVLRSNGQ